MNQYQMANAAMAFCNINGGPRDAEGQRRQYTPAELDALADFRWPWAEAKGRLAAGAKAIQSCWRPRASIRRESTVLPTTEATAPV